MSYDAKIESARTVLASHNANVDDPHRVKIEDFLDKLKSMGGTTEDTISNCSWEDLEDCGLPRLLARQVSKVFRERTIGREKSYVSSRKAEQMTSVELLDCYDPRNADNSVGKRLQSLSKGLPFVVFLDDGSVDVKTSITLLSEIKDGYASRDVVINSANQAVKPLPVGQRPDMLAEENPLYPGRVLRPDGTCDQTNRSWDGIPLVVRQVIRTALETGEVKIESLQDAHQVLDLIMNQPEGAAESFVRSRFQRATIILQELLQVGGAPSLKVPLLGPTQKNDPFYAKNRKY